MPLTAFPKWHPTNTALYGHRTVCFDSFTKPRTVWTYRLMTHETAQCRDVPDMPFYVYNLHYSINKVGESSLISRNLSLWLRLKNIPVPHRLLSGQGLHRPQYSLWCRYCLLYTSRPDTALLIQFPFLLISCKPIYWLIIPEYHLILSLFQSPMVILCLLYTSLHSVLIKVVKMQ